MKYTFLFLLPLFFVLHGMNEQLWFVPVKDALVLLLIYWAAAVVLFFVCRLFFRDNAKAALAAFLLLAFHFFFGSIHDLLGGTSSECLHKGWQCWSAAPAGSGWTAGAFWCSIIDSGPFRPRQQEMSHDQG